MIKITNITLKNFLSVGNVTQALSLSNHGLSLIIGLNTDANGGITRNGSGKSSLLQAISFGLFGKPLTNIKFDNLVNNINSKNMIVNIEFEIDNVKYRIERGRKPVVLHLYKNDEELKLETEETQGENRKTQQEIERIIGMSHNLFKNIMALTTYSDPFLRMNPTEQRKIIEELLGITQLSQRAEILKKLTTTTKDGIREQEAIIKATVEANDRIRNTIRQIQSRAQAWDVAHDKKINSLVVQLESCVNIDFEQELLNFDKLEAFLKRENEISSQVKDAEREVVLLEREAQTAERESKKYLAEAQNISASIAAQVERAKTDCARKSKLIERHRETLTRLQSEEESIQKKLSHADETHCITCEQPLKGTAHLGHVVSNLTTQLSQIQSSIESNKHEIDKLFSEIKTFEREMTELELSLEMKVAEAEEKGKQKAEEAAILQDNIISHSDTLDKLFQELAQIGEPPVLYFSSKDDLYNAKHNQERLEYELTQEMDALNPHVVQIEELTKAIQEIDYSRLNELTDNLKHEEFLYKVLTNKDSFIRKKIIDQNLAYLNSRMDYYLEKLGLPHEVQFMSDLSVEITILGKDMDFEQLSRGEQNRVILATSWAFRDVWESMNTNCNLIFIDEILDNGLDTNGAEAALALLKSFARDRGKDIFLISHKDELIGRVNNTLIAKKEDGFTTYEAMS